MLNYRNIIKITIMPTVSSRNQTFLNASALVVLMIVP